MMRDYFINRCGGIIYSTALRRPRRAIDAALDLVPRMDEERAYVARLAERFRVGASAIGLDTGASTTQIVPVILGSAGSRYRHGRAPQARRPSGRRPSGPRRCPTGTARLRVAFTAAHEDSDIDRLLEVLATEDARRPASAM